MPWLMTTGPCFDKLVKKIGDMILIEICEFKQ